MSSIKCWPPSQGGRLKFVEWATKKLSGLPRFGLLSNEEASKTAKLIEEVCFVMANESFETEPDGDGHSAMRIYKREGYRRCAEVFLNGPSPGGYVPRNVVDDFPPPRKTVFDISGWPQTLINAEEAPKLLSPLAEVGNSYTKICFSNRSFGIDAALVAAPILASLKGQLTQVDLSDFISGRLEDEALEVMRIFSSALEGSLLKYLNLSDNALDEKGVRAFESLLKSQNSLEELYLMKNKMSKKAAKALCELIPSTVKLTILHLHNNPMGDDGVIAISNVLKRSPLLEDFRFSSTNVGSAGGIVLAEALETCIHLKKLDLGHNRFGADAGIALSRTLEKLVDIVEVYLNYLSLKDEGVIAISNALKRYVSSLEVLEIAGNEITVKAAPQLAACISVKQFLKRLVLSENELKDEGAVLIGKALNEGHGQLKELDLGFNMIRRDGARCLAQSVLSYKPDFVLLNINGNAISEEGIDEVKEILMAHHSIHVLGPFDENDAKELNKRPRKRSRLLDSD